MDELPWFDCVVAADARGGIGKANELPWPRLPADLRHFREVTCKAAEGRRNAVIMGRKTWDSVPAAMRPLKGRLNIVVSRRPHIALPDGVPLAASLDDALRAAARPDIDQVLIVGGAEIYRQAFVHPRLRHVYLTRIEHTFDTDATIPALAPVFELDPTWPVATHHEANLTYHIERWRRA